MSQPKPKRHRSERGIAALEFVLVMPILLLIVGAIFNFGVAFSQKLALDNAVRQTARAAAVDTGKTPSTLAAEGKTAFESSAIGRQGETVAIVVSSCKGTVFGTPTVATGEFKSKFIFPWMVPGLPTSIDWKSKGEYVCEYA